MDKLVTIKNVNLFNEINKKSVEKGVAYKTLLKNVNSKESEAKRLYESVPLLMNICRRLGFNFFELFTDKAELQEKVNALEAELAALKQSTDRVVIEHAIYKDVMIVLKRHITLPISLAMNPPEKSEIQEG